jgi:hypothetical protein
MGWVMNLYTSIPPKVGRVVNGQDVGLIWTRMCIDSWMRAGYTVMSVNSRHEAGRVREMYPDVTVLEVERDGQEITGRPQVYLSDMLAYAVKSDQPFFAIANADVLIMTDASESLNGWHPEEGFAYSNRLDIADLNGANPQLHGGVDFVIVNANDLLGLEFPDFLFGTPWWDYWLPLALNCKGVKGHRLTQNSLPVIAHLFHQDQWSHEQFLSNYTLFTNAIAQVVSERAKWPAEVSTVDMSTGLPGAMLKMCLEYAKLSSGMIHQGNPVIDLGVKHAD